MSYRKLLIAAAIAGIVGSTAACADVTGPEQQTGVCAVSGGGQTC